MKKVLIIGSGNIALRHFKNISKLKNETEIKIFKRFSSIKNVPYRLRRNIIFDIENVVNFNPNYILICSPSSIHVNDINKFYNLFPNSRLFCEKPLTNKFKKIKKLNPKLKNKLYIGYQLRFNKLILKLRSIIKNKNYGKLLSFKIITGQDIKDWRPNKKLVENVSVKSKFGGGVLLELSHEIDLSLFLFGKPRSVFCKNKKTKYKNFDVEDNSNIFLEYKNYIATVCLDMFNPVKKRDLFLTFEKAYISVDLIKNQMIINKKNKIIKNKIKSGEYNEMIKGLFLKKKPNNFGNYKTSVYVNKIIEAAKRSSKLSKKIIL